MRFALPAFTDLPERLDVCGQAQHTLFVDHVGKARHDRLVTGNDVLVRQQDAVADVGLIGEYRAAVVQRYPAAVESLQIRRLGHRGRTVAAAAAELAEQYCALLGQRLAGTGLRQPALVLLRRLHDQRGEHLRMVGTTVLGAERLIAASLGSVEPQLRVAPGQQVLLDAQGREIQAVDGVLGDHVQPHGAPHRHVQRIDLTLPAGVLELPHPLLGDYLDLHRIDRWRADLVVQLGRDQVDDHRTDEGQHDPGHLHLHAAARAVVARHPGAFAIADGEQDGKHEHRHHEDRHHSGERPDQRVDALRMLRSRLWPQAHELIHRRPPACAVRAIATTR